MELVKILSSRMFVTGRGAVLLQEHESARHPVELALAVRRIAAPRAPRTRPCRVLELHTHRHTPNGGTEPTGTYHSTRSGADRIQHHEIDTLVPLSGCRAMGSLWLDSMLERQHASHSSHPYGRRCGAWAMFVW